MPSAEELQGERGEAVVNPARVAAPAKSAYAMPPGPVSSSCQTQPYSMPPVSWRRSNEEDVG
jgi:hypothetical protein